DFEMAQADLKQQLLQLQEQYDQAKSELEEIVKTNLPQNPLLPQSNSQFVNADHSIGQPSTRRKVVTIVDIIQLPIDSELVWGHHLDIPSIGTLEGVSRFLISGWVVGKKASATQINVWCEETLIAQTKVDKSRPDVNSVFPDVSSAQSSGYATLVKVQDLPEETELWIEAILADGTSIHLATIKLNITNLVKDNLREKCKLSVCAIIKDEASYLIEWLEFHKLVGVERFYLYNNNSTDHTTDLLQSYIRSG
ncbi:glycosyltransferase family 92 protein, partial [Planktothrix sp.]